MAYRSVKITNNFKNKLHVAVVFRECDKISSHQMRSMQTSSSYSHSGKNGGSVGYKENGSASFETENACSVANSYDKKEEDTVCWNWNDFIVPGMVVMRPYTTQTFCVSSDKPWHYITAVDLSGNNLLCEHFTTVSTNITVDEHGDIVPYFEPIVVQLPPRIARVWTGVQGYDAYDDGTPRLDGNGCVINQYY